MTERSRLILYSYAVSIDGSKLSVSGWAISTLSPTLTFRLSRGGNREIPFEMKTIRRLDASREILGNESRPDCGFKITFDGDPDKIYTLTVSDGKNKRTNRFLPSGYTLQWKYRPFGLARDYLKKYGTLIRSMRHEGFGTFFSQTCMEFRREEYRYMRWRKKRMAKKDRLDMQRKTVFPYAPKLSLIVPAYRTPKKFLLEMVKSVLDQTYGNFELCIADGSFPETEVQETLAELRAKDPRIVYKVLNENLGISGNTNEALSLVSGDWVVLMDHDDLLSPDALYELVKLMNEDPEASVIYTDEDKISMDLRRYFHPAMKPEFDRVFLESNNYICHLFAVKKEIVDWVGLFDPSCDGSQDHDYILRCTELGRVRHLPKAVYHWRTHPNSTAEDPRSKMYCYIAGARAVNLHYERLGVRAKAYIAPFFGHYETFFDVPDQKKRVSVVLLGHGTDADKKNTEESFRAHSADCDLEFLNGPSDIPNAKGEYLFFVRTGAVLEKSGALATDFDGESVNRDDLKPFPYNLIARLETGEFGLAGARIVDPAQHLSYAGTVKNPKSGADYLFRNEFRDSAIQNGIIIDSRRTASVSEDGFMIAKALYDRLDPIKEDTALSGLRLSLEAEELGYPSVYEHTVVICLPDQNDRLSPVIRHRALAKAIAKKHAALLALPDPVSNPSMTVHLGKHELKEKARP